MTREEIINNLLHMKRYVKEDTTENSTIDEAIKALEQQTCEEGERMTEYMIKEDEFMALTGDITDCTIEEFIARLRNKLSKLPSVTLQPKIGKWVEGGYEDMYYVCSECDYKASEYWVKPKYKYCPNCGAKMQEVKE